MTKVDLVIVSAGPNGVSATNYPRAIKRFDVRAWGEPLSLWNRNAAAQDHPLRPTWEQLNDLIQA